MSQEFQQQLQTESAVKEYKALLLAIIKSLKDQRVSLQILTNLPDLGISLPPELPDTEKAEYVLKHSTFFNYHLTANLVHKFSEKEDLDNLKEIFHKYEKTFSEYGRCDCLSQMNYFNDGIRDCLSEVSQSSALATLLMIFTPGKKFLTVGDLHDFCYKFRTKINFCPTFVFNLCHIEAMDHCSFKLTLQVPVSVVCGIEKFVHSSEQEMTAMGINHLYFISQFINRPKYQVLISILNHDYFVIMLALAYVYCR